MGKLGGGGLLVLGLLLAVTGVLIQSDMLQWLLDVMGSIFVIAGVIVGVFGVVKIAFGGRSPSAEF